MVYTNLCRIDIESQVDVEKLRFRMNAEFVVDVVEDGAHRGFGDK